MANNTIYGRNPVIEAFKSGQKLEKIFLLNSIHGEFEVTIRSLCKDNNTPLAKVPSPKLDQLSRNNNHQGIVAVMSPIEYSNIDTLVPRLLEKGLTPLLLILDGITDVRNMGAIARSAKVFGVNGVVVPSSGSARVSNEMVKASAGALLDVPVCRETSVLVAVETLQQMGIQVLASDLKSSNEMSECDFTKPTAIVLGSEDRGVSKKLLQICDQSFIIPQNSQFDSLNVSVAAGIILYEAMIQRRKG